MGRLFVTSIIIAALLACPYACQAGGNCCGTSDVVSRPPCCVHCAERSESIPQPQPIPPTDEPCSSCCVCHGALLASAVLDVRPPTESWLAVPPIPAFPIVSQSHEYSSCGGAESSLFGDGLRIALGSLLC